MNKIKTLLTCGFGLLAAPELQDIIDQKFDRNLIVSVLPPAVSRTFQQYLTTFINENISQIADIQKRSNKSTQMTDTVKVTNAKYDNAMNCILELLREDKSRAGLKHLNFAFHILDAEGQYGRYTAANLPKGKLTLLAIDDQGAYNRGIQPSPGPVVYKNTDHEMYPNPNLVVYFGAHSQQLLIKQYLKKEGEYWYRQALDKLIEDQQFQDLPATSVILVNVINPVGCEKKLVDKPEFMDMVASLEPNVLHIQAIFPSREALQFSNQ